MTAQDLAALRAKREAAWQPELELLAILISLRLWLKHFECSTVCIHGDAKSALHAGRKQAARSATMNALSGEVGLTVEVYSIELVVKHLPGAANIDADAISRLAGGAKSVPTSLRNVERVSPPVRDASFFEFIRV